MTVQDYLDKVPRELPIVVCSINDDITLATLILFVDRHNEKLTFKEVKSYLDLDSAKVTKSLNSLLKSGLIAEVIVFPTRNRYYKITNIGDSMMRSLIKGILFIEK
jgi:DNA-binding MarR family transcriptional regulator